MFADCSLTSSTGAGNVSDVSGESDPAVKAVKNRNN